MTAVSIRRTPFLNDENHQRENRQKRYRDCHSRGS